MKVVAYYKTRVLADEDHAFLMSKGIASVVYGDAAPAVLEEHFGKEPVCIAVLDSQYDRVKSLLNEKHNYEILDKLKGWTHKVNREALKTKMKKEAAENEQDLNSEPFGE